MREGAGLAPAGEDSLRVLTPTAARAPAGPIARARSGRPPRGEASHALCGEGTKEAKTCREGMKGAVVRWDMGNAASVMALAGPYLSLYHSRLWAANWKSQRLAAWAARIRPRAPLPAVHRFLLDNS